MKAITLTQPYATLVALGAKRIETRSWATAYRGPLAIHAGLGLKMVGGLLGLMQLGLSAPFAPVLLAAGYGNPGRLPRGVIIAVCDLIDCRPTGGPRSEQGTGPKYADWVHELSAQERAFGDYTPGRYGWLLDNVRALPEPVPARGALGLWTLPAEVGL